MDLSEYFKSHFQDMYKSKGGDFGRALNHEVRAKKMCEHRKKARTDFMLNRRNIREDSVETPKPMETLQKERLDQLLKWKQEKAKRLQEQKVNTKPVFKVSRVPSVIPIPTLPNINKKNVTNKKYNFAPRDYKFQGPINIKPVNVDREIKREQPNCGNSLKRVTRSQKPILSPVPTLPIRQRRIKTKKNLINRITVDVEPLATKQTIKQDSGIKTPKKTPARIKNHVRSIEKELPQTPESQTKLEDGGCPVNYISPYVTISRGKNSARKEYFDRKSKGGSFDASPELLNNTGPKASAAYFHQLLNREIARIQGLCDEWNVYMNEEVLPEGACDMINVAIGQSQLLIRKKFKKFQELISSCERNDLERIITSEDLHGYWDTSYIQVENLDKRFKNLEDLRANNWEEIIPETSVAQPKKKVARNPKKQVTSKLRDVVRAARRKALFEKTDTLPEANTFHAGFFSVCSPQKSPPPQKSPIVGENSLNSVKKTPQVRKSLYKSVLSTEMERGTRSPGLIVVAATQGVRCVEAFSESEDTPTKSILKTHNSKSSVKKTKSVLFETKNSPNDENSPRILPSPTDTAKPRRRSSRLIRSKLF